MGEARNASLMAIQMAKSLDRFALGGMSWLAVILLQLPGVSLH
jgi:hypothetical protein